jgi:hypothetical protein
MAVVSVSTFSVKPDRFEDELADVRKVKALIEKHGGKNVRLMAALVAGQQTGSMVLISETDDFAAQGASLDRVLADPEGLAMLASVGTSASPITGLQMTTWVDVPL